MADKFLEFLANAGPTGTIVGICFALLFYLRRQESGIRADINGSLARLQQEKETLQAELEAEKKENDAKEAQIDAFRTERRAAEDEADIQRRKAEAAERALIEAREQLDALRGSFRDMDR